MSREIVIDPVTRIEGHSKITIQLDDRGEVADAQFHVTQFRGFERITQGRPVHEMPAIMARICGICPVSHLIASSKAVDDILAVEPPPTGADLRRSSTWARSSSRTPCRSSTFLRRTCSSVLTPSRPSATSSDVARENPQLARDGIELRKWGQQIIEWLGGKRIHPSGSFPAASPIR
jgi:NAD-reducing hydrogenase large subunit